MDTGQTLMFVDRKERSTGMLNNLDFKKADVLVALKKNLEEHRKIVREAQVGYRKQFEQELELKLAALRAGDRVNPNSELVVPPHHVEDYERAIQILEMCVDEEVELDEHEFQAYVRGQWSWQRQFLTTNSVYSASATAALGD